MSVAPSQQSGAPPGYGDNPRLHRDGIWRSGVVISALVQYKGYQAHPDDTDGSDRSTYVRNLLIQTLLMFMGGAFVQSCATRLSLEIWGCRRQVGHCRRLPGVRPITCPL